MKRGKLFTVILITLSMLITTIGCGGSEKKTPDTTTVTAAVTDKTSETTQADNTPKLQRSPNE
jgi:hypothetical protein